MNGPGGAGSGAPGRPGREQPPLVSDAELAALAARMEAAGGTFLEDLERLVNVDCGTYLRDGVNAVADRTAALLQGLGGRLSRHPDPAGALGDTLVATFDGEPGGPRALLIGHLDTVFGEGTAAARPFRVEGGRAFGPGVSDMKGGLLTLLHGLGILRDALGTAGLPFERLTVIANPDEEIGSPVSTTLIRAAAAQADVAFVLECARANGDIVSSRKGAVDYRVTIRGRAAHAGVEPEKGRSAITEAAHQVLALHDLSGRWPGVTCNVGTIEGGLRPNVVAERAVLGVDVRAADRAGLEAADAAVRALAAAPSVPDVAVEVDERHRHWPMEKLARSGRLVEHARGLAARLGFALDDAATGGASDANTTAGMGVPTLDGLGPIGGLDHSPGEYLEVASIAPRTVLFAALLLAVGRDPMILGWRSGRR